MSTDRNPPDIKADRILGNNSFVSLASDMATSLLLLLTAVLDRQATVESGAVPVGIIRNVSLTISEGNPTTIHDTCQSCLCGLLSNSWLFGWNRFNDNLTCQMYSKADQSKPFSLVYSSGSTFYFLSFPTYVQSESVTSSTAKYATISSGK